MITISEVRSRHAQPGRLNWIGVRPERYAEMTTPKSVEIDVAGCIGDHSRGGKRAVTLIQAEHLPVIAALAGQVGLAPEVVRRNLVISGLNLLAIRKGPLLIGDVLLQLEGPCPPCTRMEKAIGPGGYNAMRGHGGWYASVVTPGYVSLTDPVTAG